MYRCNSFTWEVTFENFIWSVQEVFFDRPRGKAVISIKFDYNVRTIEADITQVNSVQAALDFAKSLLSDEVIQEQELSTIRLTELTEKQKYQEWEAFGKELVYEFNAMSSGMTTQVSDIILTHVQPVLIALNGAALGVARKRLNETSVETYFPLEVKQYFLNKIDEYLANWVPQAEGMAMMAKITPIEPPKKLKIQKVQKEIKIDYESIYYKELDKLPTVDSSEIKEFDVISIYTKFYWYRPISYLSKIIREVRKVPVNHLGIVYTNEDNVKMFVEANEKGVVETPLKKKIEKWEKWGDICVKHHFNRNDILPPIQMYKRIASTRGKKYGFWYLIKFFWSTIIREPFRSAEAARGDKFVCSQYVMYILGDPEFSKFSPKEVWDKTNQEKKRIVF